MPAVTIRNLSEEAHRALKVRATQHGRSTEAEIRDILESAVRPPQRVRMGSALSQLGRKAGLRNEDIDALQQQAGRKAPAEPPSLE